MPPPTLPNVALTSNFLFDALIIGAGPAGLSAALTLSRVRGTSAVFSNNTFRNAKGHRAHYVLSRDHQPAPELRRIGREEIERYGTTRFVERGVARARRDEVAGLFEVEDERGEMWRGRKVVLAMGVADAMETGIEGYEECWGGGIHQCLFCDGIEMSDLPAGVLGFESPMQLHSIGLILKMGCPGVTVFGNGSLEPMDDETRRALQVAKRRGAKVDERRIARFVQLGEREGMEIRFEDGSSTRVGFVAHKPVTRVNGRHIADGLGVEVVADGMGGDMLRRSEPFGGSNVKGVFVAGDAGVLMKSFVSAMSQGVAAGAGVANTLVGEEHQRVGQEVEDLERSG